MRLRWLLSRFGLVLLATFSVLGVVIVGTSMFGLVEGEEFAAGTLERRTYQYYELPIIGTQVTPTRRTTHRPELEQMLIDKKFVTAKDPPERWDLVVSHRDGPFSNAGDARILCRYLDAFEMEDGHRGYWQQWTDKHPVLAKILWSEVAMLARRQLYFLVPELFQAAGRAENRQELQTEFDHLLADSFERLAVAEVDLKNDRAAADFFTDALSYDPDRESCITQRAACQQRLGDLQRVDQRHARAEAEE